MIAAAAATFLVVVDSSKLVSRLGETMPVPVEGISMVLPYVLRRLRQLEGEPLLRLADTVLVGLPGAEEVRRIS